MVVREVILRGWVGAQIRRFAEERAMEYVKAADRSSFVEDVVEDLAQIEECRLVGLGVTPEELRSWQRLKIETEK